MKIYNKIYKNVRGVLTSVRYCILKCNLFQWRKAKFSASLLQSSVTHDPSEIILIYWFTAQETFLSSMLRTTVLLKIFVEINGAISFFLELEMFKRTAFIKTELFCNIINVFTVVIFDQFNASLHNKSTSFDLKMYIYAFSRPFYPKIFTVHSG